jgi:hypothetical protein
MGNTTALINGTQKPGRNTGVVKMVKSRFTVASTRNTEFIIVFIYLLLYYLFVSRKPRTVDDTISCIREACQETGDNKELCAKVC